MQGNAQQGKTQFYWYQNDQLGTPIGLTDGFDETLYECQYNAYGQIIDETYHEVGNRAIPDNLLRFQGQYYDEETGLHYNLNRYYAPFVGRYITQDPIKLIGGLNLYQYSPNPVNWIDPLGLSSVVTSGTEFAIDFYVGPNGPSATLPATGYSYMRYLNDDSTVNNLASLTLDTMTNKVSYFGFRKFSNGSAAKDAYQISKSWSDARLLGEFDTLQLFENGLVQARIPNWAGDTMKGKLEPFAMAYPEYGLGGSAATTCKLYVD